jgi:hypothetical protein
MDTDIRLAEERRLLVYQAGKYFRRERPAGKRVDDKTWSDLSGDDFFLSLDSCRSSPGRSVLYARMRETPESPAELASRQAATDAIAADAAGSGKLGRILDKLGPSRDFCVHEYFSSISRPASRAGPGYYPYIAAASLLCYLSPLLLGAPGLALALAALIIELSIYVRFKKSIMTESEPIFYVSKLIHAGARLAAADTSLFKDERARMGALAKRLAPLRQRCAFFRRSMSAAADFIDAAMEIFKMLLLLEASNYSAARSGCAAEREALDELFGLVGGIDAGLCAARYLEDRSPKAPVTLREDRFLEAHGMVHPLLEEAVPNSISIAGRGIIITGTNMSGKSTFLRALGLNLILANLSGYALADSFSSPILRPASAINDVDDILGGKSRYLGEAERLLEFVRLSEKRDDAIFLIDEILSGTNSSERTVAAVAILRYLCGKGALTVAATHDLAIARELDGPYDNYHFDDEVTQEGLRFDYRIKPGIVAKRNALRLLSYLGYPGEIVDSFGEETLKG